MWAEFDNALQFDGEGKSAKLLSFGVSVESVVQAVLQQAESLHYSEVAKRATKMLGRIVDERFVRRVRWYHRAPNCSAAWLMV